jgi:hypothetical protein
MKALKYILIVLVSIVALIMVVALFVPKEMMYEKSISINAPIDIVWENVNSLADMDAWSPWNEKDPNMKKTNSGVDGTVGAIQSWESDVEGVGTGSQTIAKINPPYYIETELKFYDPYESEAVGYVKLEEIANNEISATWGFKSEMPYPFNIMSLFMNMDDMMGDDWNKGLTKLKFLSEI